MSSVYCAYPFLKEESHMCDYEIATDRLASMLSMARHHVHHISQDVLLQLIEMIYHANGSIRGNCAIGTSDLEKLQSFIHVTMFLWIALFCPMAASEPAICMFFVQKRKRSFASCIRYSVRE